MVHFNIKEVLLALVTWVVFIQVRHWYRWRALKKWGKQQGCEDVPTVENKLPWGFERFSFLVNGKFKSGFPPISISLAIVQLQVAGVEEAQNTRSELSILSNGLSRRFDSSSPERNGMLYISPA
jgi:hypothetical protein